MKYTIPSLEALMRTLLLHLARGYSLHETVVRAKAAGVAELSAVALFKRLRNAEEWLNELTGLAIKLATKTAETGSDWEKPNAIATTIEGVISSAQYSLTGKELAAFTVGRLLGHWMAIDIDDKSLSTKTQEDILNGIRALSIDGVVPPEVTRVFEEYRSPDANSFRSYHHQVYSAVRQMLI